MVISGDLLRLLGIDPRDLKIKEPSAAAQRDPHFPRQPLTERPMVLSERTRVRGGKRSRRRIARVWEPGS